MSCLRIGTWNIASTDDFESVLLRISRLELDMCALQEVSGDAHSDITHRLASGTSGRTAYTGSFTPALAAVSAKHQPSRQYGLATIFRSGIHTLWTSTRILGPVTAQPEKRTAESEPRLLQITLVAGAYPLLLGNTHLAHTPDWRQSTARGDQSTDIALYLSYYSQKSKILLCGDFNAEPDSGDIEPIRKVLPFCLPPQSSSYVGESPGKILDYFLSSDPMSATVEIHDATGLSDHNLIVLHIEV